MNEKSSLIPAKLSSVLQQHAPLLIALSGGQDSLVLLASAKALDLPVDAATIVSEFSVPGEMERASEMCRRLGVCWHPIEVSLLDNPAIRSNPVDRCYLCKQFADADIGKSEIQDLGDALGIPRIPPSSCLATRIPFGVPITAERLKLIAAAETLLRDQGISGILRVRLIADEAVVEVEAWEMQKALALLGQIEDLGFSHVRVAGYTAGGVERWRQTQQ